MAAAGKLEDKILVLDWYKRLEIAVHVAQGLDYLHSFAVATCIPSYTCSDCAHYKGSN